MASALPETERQRYEQAIVHFQNDLAGSKPPGFIGATSFQIEAVLWLSDLPGYEDWYLLDGTRRGLRIRSTIVSQNNTREY